MIRKILAAIAALLIVYAVSNPVTYTVSERVGKPLPGGGYFYDTSGKAIEYRDIEKVDYYKTSSRIVVVLAGMGLFMYVLPKELPNLSKKEDEQG